MANESVRVWIDAYKQGVVDIIHSMDMPFLNFCKDCMVLDVGCGDGANLLNLEERFSIKPFGVDIVTSRR